MNVKGTWDFESGSGFVVCPSSLRWPLSHHWGGPISWHMSMLRPLALDAKAPPWVSKLPHSLHDIPGKEYGFIVLFVSCEAVVNGLEYADICWVQGTEFRETKDGDEFMSKNFDVDSRQCGGRSSIRSW